MKRKPWDRTGTRPALSLEGIAWRSAAEQALWSVDLENICEVHGIDGPVPGAAFVVESLLDRLA
ncbi:hypothetical protein [Burkholderia sp. LMU1-1-1.1]|uniref:hypothetical protein n=1 Tax=Burkholderia sp. LMU1-1-1.1 TaxID=3135266 RepID=UPI0034210BC8